MAPGVEWAPASRLRFCAARGGRGARSYLVCDFSAYMTGACLTIDGGSWLEQRSYRARMCLMQQLGAIAEPAGAVADGSQTLTQMTCVACRRDAPTVAEAEIAELYPQILEWELVEIDGIKRLRRVFSFRDFAEALEFTNRVGELAEEEGHHPALLTEWGRTTVTWWTHKIRGLHRNDFIMAAKTNELAPAAGT